MFKWKNYVYEVYKEKSFSKAAHNLYISQPYLSAKIKAIEEELGAPIFDRSTTPIRLTAVGEVYIKAAEDISKIEEQVESYVNNMNTLRVGHLSIGASNVFAAYALPGIITEYKNKYPEVDVRLTEGNTAALEEMLSQNSLDMVIDNNHYDSALYDRELYSKEMILLAIPKKFDICREIEKYSISEEALRTGAYLSSEFPTVPLEKLKDIPFIMLAPGNDTRIRGDKLCFEAGFRPKIILELNQQATAYMTASTEMGATFVSDILAAGLPIQSTLLYFKLSGDAARRNVYFYYKKRKFKTKAMEEFVKAIENRNNPHSL